MRTLYYWLLVVRLALRWTRQFNLGDEVVYHGERWILNQGVRDPLWSLCHADGRYIEVHRENFRKASGLRSLWRSFQSGYRFYMRSWFDIWVREGIKPWMRGCSIWAGKPPRATSGEKDVER